MYNLSTSKAIYAVFGLNFEVPIFFNGLRTQPTNRPLVQDYDPDTPLWWRSHSLAEYQLSTQMLKKNGKGFEECNILVQLRIIVNDDIYERPHIVNSPNNMFLFSGVLNCLMGPLAMLQCSNSILSSWSALPMIC